MAINRNLIIHGIILYVIFIIGIAIISEWLCSNHTSRKRHVDKNILTESHLNSILESIKEDIRKEYLNKLHNKTEHFSNHLEYSKYNKPQYNPSEEELIMKQASDKLNKDSTISDYSNHQQLYSQNLFKQYSKVPKELKWNEPIKVIIPPKDSYNVDYKYNFIPSSIPNDIQNDNLDNYKITGIDNNDNYYSVL